MVSSQVILKQYDWRTDHSTDEKRTQIQVHYQYRKRSITTFSGVVRRLLGSFITSFGQERVPVMPYIEVGRQRGRHNPSRYRTRQ